MTLAFHAIEVVSSTSHDFVNKKNLWEYTCPLWNSERSPVCWGNKPEFAFDILMMILVFVAQMPCFLDPKSIPKVIK